MKAVASRMTLLQRRHEALALRPRLLRDQWHVWDNVTPRTRTRLDSWFMTSLARYVHDYRDAYFGRVAVGPYDYAVGLSNRDSTAVSYVTQRIFEDRFGGELGYLEWKAGTARTWLRFITVYGPAGHAERRATASTTQVWRSAGID